MSSNRVHLIKEVFENEFQKEKFDQFIIELFNGNITKLFNDTNEPIGKEYEEHVKTYNALFSYTNRGKKLVVLTIELENENMIKRARGMQRNFVAKFLEVNDFDGALVAFYTPGQADWRLSFVKMDFVFTEKGVSKKITTPKRSSFIIGKKEPSHTAKKQILPLINKEEELTFEDIEEAFSVERVTKEFFEKYKNKYLELKEYLDSDQKFLEVSKEKGFTSEEFAKKILGQIAFLYFLQKKGWLGIASVPEKISKESLFEIYYSLETEETRELLLKSFYKFSESLYEINTSVVKSYKDTEAETLSLAFKGTRYFKTFGEGDKAFLRNLFRNKQADNNFFENYLEPLFYEALNRKRGDTHYFARFNKRIPFLNGGLFEPLEGYDWKNINFEIPDSFFSDVNDENEGKGILDIFDLFNFTINESEPLETEVAIDPEMLGKIFENLLEVTDRKSKGAFYTPREIVHYMCQESLLNYLVNTVVINKEDLRQFINNGDLLKSLHSDPTHELEVSNEIISKASELDEALKNVKIADPAVGSGAFALGMLNEIVKLRLNLTDYILYSYEETYREQVKRTRSPYRIKLETMQNNIFAVDIEYSATDITKLRLWLSLIVDNEIDTVNPLPNLENNIKVGNSLIQEFKGMELFNERLLKQTKKSKQQLPKSKKVKEKLQFALFKDQSDDLLKKLQTLQKKLFNEHEKEVKEEIKSSIEKIEWDLIEYNLIKNGNEKEIKEIENLKKNRTKPFFLWKRDFSDIFIEKDGFDIVIGNPPYGAEIPKDQKEVIKKKLKDTRNLNSAAIFIDYSKNFLLNEKGILSFIVPKSLLYSEKWYDLAQSLMSNTDVLVDVEKAFEKVKLEQILFVYNSYVKTDQYNARKFLDKSFIRSNLIENKIAKDLKAWICDVKSEELEILKNLNVKLEKMSNISNTKRGVGLQKFLLEEGEIPVIGGKNLMRFGINGVKGFLSEKDMLNNKNKVDFMRQPKIMSQDLIAHIQNPQPRLKITSCYDESGEIFGVDTVQNTVITDDKYNPYYITALLNSDFVSWYTYKFIYCSAIRTMHFDNKYIGKIIIPDISLEQQQPLINLTYQLQEIYSKGINGVSTEDNEKIIKYQKELNNVTYKLFGISKAEVEIINKQFKELESVTF